MRRSDALSRREALLATAGSTIAAASMSLPASVAGKGASVTGSKTFERGTHVLNADTQLFNVVVEDGARIVLGSGVTLTVTGDFDAAANMVFSGPGRVDLTKSRLLAARPEWWGAVPDDEAVDCVPALEACLEAHVAMQLSPGSYYISRTWTIAISDRRIWGVGRSKDSRSTRIVLSGGNGTVMCVGTETPPGSINDFVRGLAVGCIELTRNLAPALGGSTAIGLRVVHAYDCLFETVRGNEQGIGFSLFAVVKSYFRDCHAFRSTAGSAFIGYDLTGEAAGMAGANASIFLIDCTARVGGTPKIASSVGVRLLGTFADTFIVRFETVTLDDGIVIDGSPATTSASRRRFGHIDLTIDTPILDQCLKRGITIRGISSGGAIDIRSPYVALGSTGTVAMQLVDCAGLIDTIGGQLIGGVASDGGTDPMGIALTNVTGATFTRTKIIGFDRAINAGQAKSFELVVSIGTERDTEVAAIRLVGCADGYLRPLLSGASRKTGVFLDATSKAITIDTTGLRDAAVSISGKKMAAVGGRITVAR